MIFCTELKQIFNTPTPLEVAAGQLLTAEHELLKAETGLEFATSVVNFNKAQIRRLQMYIAAKTLEVTK